MISELPATAADKEASQLDAAAQDLKGHATHIREQIVALADCLTKTMLASDNTTVSRTGDEVMRYVADLLAATDGIGYRAADLERRRDAVIRREAREEIIR